MDRRAFLKKLGQSVLIISAVAVSGKLFSGKGNDTNEACPAEENCKYCSSYSGCGLPKRVIYSKLNSK